jgi:hypothetical protein
VETGDGGSVSRVADLAAVAVHHQRAMPDELLLLLCELTLLPLMRRGSSLDLHFSGHLILVFGAVIFRDKRSEFGSGNVAEVEIGWWSR